MVVISTEKSVETASQRANIYRFFSLVFAKEPSEKFVKEVTQEPLLSILKELGIVFDDVFFTENAAEELGFEYVRVFIGVGEKHIPPYESFFIETVVVGGKEKRRLMGEAAVAVKKNYIESGYLPDKKFKDMPDHLAVELDFISRLCAQEVEALKKNNAVEVQRLHKQEIDFLENHLLKWIDDFVVDVKDFTKLDFYKSASEVLSEFLKNDLQTLKNQ